MKDEIRGALRKSGVVAVLVIDHVEDAVPVARALLQGGVTTMELTLRTEAALPALQAIGAEVPEMLAGVGTILTPDQVGQVVDAGAAFGVAPGLNRRVLEAAIEAGLPFGPGIATPSDIETALEYDLRLLKFFPAEPSGGLPYLRSMAAPYAHLGIEYIPLGGVSQANLAAYLDDSLICAVGGSWLATRSLILDKNWIQITDNARQAAETVAHARQG